MNPYAVVMTGGKQYRVQKDEVLRIERLPDAAGAQVQLSKVLAVSDGNELKIGQPDVAGAEVTVQVLKHLRGPKVVAFKKKRRKGYKRKVGHRQELTEVKVVALGAG